MCVKRLLLLLMIASLSLGGCRLVFKPDIKQGNILTVKDIHAIKPGMDKSQVLQILGTPILINLFADNQMIYVYTIQPGHGQFKRQQVRVYFSNGRVTHYTSDVH